MMIATVTLMLPRVCNFCYVQYVVVSQGVLLSLKLVLNKQNKTEYGPLNPEDYVLQVQLPQCDAECNAECRAE